MSTNPFRQTKFQPDAQSAAVQPVQVPTRSDGSGSRTEQRPDLPLEIKVPQDAFHRHVSFASPPVDSTIPAPSYPSSPESIRSPQSYFTRTSALVTPDYRSAIQSDPFEDLRRDQQEDGTLRQAVFNAETNIAVSQPQGQPELPQERAVWDTLSRFASAPSRPQAPEKSTALPGLKDNRKSLDVDAFKRLLLTGNTNDEGVGIEPVQQAQQNTRRPAPPPPRSNAAGNLSTNKAPETTFGYTSPSSSEPKELDAKRASFIDSLVQQGEDKRSLESSGKLPPPAPAPRRAKSVKSRDISPLPGPRAGEVVNPSEALVQGQESTSKKPPAPPLARRTSQRAPSNKSDESIATPSPAASPAEPAHLSVKATSAPPPPPVRRQPPATVRRPSQDLAPTIEEPEQPDDVATSESRRASTEQVLPSGSRNSSITIKRPNQGLMNPPPLPPPRKGRGSSRSSMDSFRPSLATLLGDENAQENASSGDHSRRESGKDRSSLTPSNADSILAELAHLQKEVDAARRN